MTDNDIIKALECCSKRSLHHYPCKDCPLFREECLGGASLMKPSIDLINRQKAEIGRLNKQLEELKFLESRVNSIKNTPKDTFSGILISMAEGVARYEAIEEFAERFESKLNCIPQHHFTLAQVLYDLDKTKKEMVGEG